MFSSLYLPELCGELWGAVELWRAEGGCGAVQNCGGLWRCEKLWGAVGSGVELWGFSHIVLVV